MPSRNNRYGLLTVVNYLPRFISFIFTHFPSSKIALIVSALGVLSEFAALSVMFPLAGVNTLTNSTTSSTLVETWREIAAWVGFADELRTWLFFLMLLLGLRITIGFAQLALNTWVSKSIFTQISSSTFSNVVINEPIAIIYRRSIGHYISLAGDEAVRLGQVFFHLSQTLTALVSAGIGLIVLFIYSPLAFLLTLFFLLFSGLCIGINLKKVFSWSTEAAYLTREANTTFIESFNGIRSIRSMGGDTYVSRQYRKFNDRYGRVLFLLDVFNHAARTLPGLLLILLGLIALFPTNSLFQDFTAIYFFTVTTMLIRVLGFLGVAVSSGGRLAIDIRAAFDLEDIIRHNSVKIEEPKTAKLVTTVSKISMVNLFCGYSENDPILRNVSAELISGRSYALVGKSGSGKSTLSDILLGLLPPLSGELLIEGSPYYDLSLTSLRRKVVLVEQQSRIFSGSVRENIALGLDVSAMDLQNAIETAGLSEFIDSLPKGLETRLDYQGANISGGQRQRIGLARAILRKPDVLILDEATSALDSNTRDLILQRLKLIFENKILLFITHDSYVTRVVDEVWNIKDSNLEIEVRKSIS
jgi:ABC-type bacteriocin/lantibiotic exporter with double-glycine peptidase domain